MVWAALSGFDTWVAAHKFDLSDSDFLKFVIGALA